MEPIASYKGMGINQHPRTQNFSPRYFDLPRPKQCMGTALIPFVSNESTKTGDVRPSN